MINANDYDTLEELELAMHAEAKDQIQSIIIARSNSIKNIVKMLDLMTHADLDTAVSDLNQKSIYWKATAIENLANDLAGIAADMKHFCRLIPLKKEDHESEGSTYVD